MLRDGEPEALAVLCQRRGPAVLAYCEQVTERAHATEATAEAFAQFRLAILSPGALGGAQHAEALLRSATRRAALARGVASRTGSERSPARKGCEEREIELLAYLDDALAPADREELAAHGIACASCAATLRQLEAAEHAFEAALKAPLPRPVAEAILTALARAAPVTAREGNASAVRDEALLLLTADDVAPATPVKRAEQTSRVDDLSPLPASASHRPMMQRLRPSLPRLGDAWLRPGRSSALMRGAARFVAVVVMAGAAGILLGMGIAELTR